MDNICVAIRVRPLIQRELCKDAESHWKVEENTLTQVENGVPVPSNIINPTTFTFDKVYAGFDTAKEIYDTFAKPVVLKAMEGFNGTIFAYGQTGTGKTYTMMGHPENFGIIPRSINDVFDLINMAPGREFLIRVSYMEIYNEVITDLLKIDGSNLKVRNNEKNEVFVENLSEVPIASADQALHFLQVGERHRRFGETNMNEKSSRSHAIFRVTIESRLASKNSEDPSDDNAVIVSQLNLVDLAGSERAAQTGAQGTRLKESGFINKSLLTLGTVISKLSSAGEERNFIPYRDSKLTRILQNSLGGNAKTSIIATVTPAVAEETLSTLKFASRAKTIKNKPKVNEVVDGDTMMKRYRKEINMLKKQIDEIQETTGIVHLKEENEKMEQKLEEYERNRRTQTEKISTLQNLIISSSEESLLYKKAAKPTRRETWCPGKLKRSLARAQESSSQVFRLSRISSESESDSEEPQQSFLAEKSDFLRDLEKEERKSLEEFKRKRSGGSTTAAPMLKYRRSYQSALRLETKRDQQCQTELYMGGTNEENQVVERPSDPELLEALQIFKDDNANKNAEIEELNARVNDLQKWNIELTDQNDQLIARVTTIETEKHVVLKDTNENMNAEIEELNARVIELQKLNIELTDQNDQLIARVTTIEIEKEDILKEISKERLGASSQKFVNVSKRRKGRSLSPHFSPLAVQAKRPNIEKNSPKKLQDLACQTEVPTPSPSKAELKEELSLANFVILEKDIESEELQMMLSRAKETLLQKEETIENLRIEISTVSGKSDTIEDELNASRNGLLNNSNQKLQSTDDELHALTVELDKRKAECALSSEGKIESDKLLSGYTEKLEQVNYQLSESRKALVEKESVLQNLKEEQSKEIVSSMEKIDDLQAHIREIEVNQSCLEKELYNIKLERSNLEQSVENKEQLITGLQNEQIELLSSIKNSEDVKAQLSTLEEDKIEMVGEFKVKKEELEKCIDDKERRIIEMQDKLYAKEEVSVSQIESLQTANCALEESKAVLEEELKDTRKEKIGLSKLIEDLEKEIAKLKAGESREHSSDFGQLESLRESVCKLEGRKHELQEELDKIKKDQTRLKICIENKDEVITQLRAGEKDTMMSTNEQLDTLRNIICELEEKKADLEDRFNKTIKDKTELEICIENKDRVITKLRAGEKQLDSLQNAVCELEEGKQLLEDELSKILKEKTALELCIENKEKVITDLRGGDTENKIVAEQKLQELQALVFKLEKNKTELEEKCEAIIVENNNLEACLKEKGNSITELHESNHETSSDEHLEKLSLRITELEETNEELLSEIKGAAKLKEEHGNLKQQLAAMQDEFGVSNADISSGEKEIKLEELELRITELEILNEELQEQLVKKDATEEKEKTKALEQQIKHLEKEIEDLTSRSRLNSSSSHSEELQKKVEKLEDKNSTLSKQLAMLSDDLQSAEDENMNLFEQINLFKQASGEQAPNKEEYQTSSNAEILELKTKLAEKEGEFSLAFSELELIKEQKKDILLQFEEIKTCKKKLEMEMETVKLEANELRITAEIKEEEMANMADTLKTRLTDKENSDREQNELQLKNDDAMNRIQVMSQENNELTVKLETLQLNEAQLREKAESLQSDLENTSKTNIEHKNEITRLERECAKANSKADELKDILRSYEEEISGLTERKKCNDELLCTISSLTCELEQERKQVFKINEYCAQQKVELAKLLNERKNMVDKDSVEKNITELQNKLKQAESLYADCKATSEEESKSFITKTGELSKQIDERNRENCEKSINIAKLENENVGYLDQIKALTEERSELSARCQELEKLEKDEKLARQRIGELETLKTDLENMTKKTYEYKTEITRLENLCDEADDEVNELNETIRKYQEQIPESTERSQSNTEVLKRIQSLTNDLEEERKRFASLKDENVGYLDQIKVLTDKGNELSARCQELEKLEKNEESARQRIGELETLKTDLENMTKKNYEYKTEITRLENLCDEADDEVNELNETIRKYQEQIPESTERSQSNTEVLKRIQSLTNDLQEEKKRFATLKEERDDVRNELTKWINQGSNDRSNSRDRDEIEALQISLEKAKKENLRSEAEVTKLRKDYEKLCDDADEELNDALKVTYQQQEAYEKEKKLLEENIKSLQKKLTENEDLNRLKEELDSTRKERFDKMCDAVTLEKENRGLKQELEESEKARATYEAYQEKRVASLKSELKRLRDENPSTASHDNQTVKGRGVIESTAVFALRSEKAHLERETNRLKLALEDVTKKNRYLSLEKYNLESKFNSLRTETYQLKRGLRGVSQDAGTQTLKENSSNIENRPTGLRSNGTENSNDRGFLAHDLYPFKEKEDPANCAQQ